LHTVADCWTDCTACVHLRMAQFVLTILSAPCSGSGSTSSGRAGSGSKASSGDRAGSSVRRRGSSSSGGRSSSKESRGGGGNGSSGNEGGSSNSINSDGGAAADAGGEDVTGPVSLAQDAVAADVTGATAGSQDGCESDLCHNQLLCTLPRQLSRRTRCLTQFARLCQGANPSIFQTGKRQTCVPTRACQRAPEKSQEPFHIVCLLWLCRSDAAEDDTSGPIALATSRYPLHPIDTTLQTLRVLICHVWSPMSRMACLAPGAAHCYANYEARCILKLLQRSVIRLLVFHRACGGCDAEAVLPMQPRRTRRGRVTCPEQDVLFRATQAARCYSSGAHAVCWGCANVWALQRRCDLTPGATLANCAIKW